MLSLATIQLAKYYLLTELPEFRREKRTWGWDVTSCLTVISDTKKDMRVL